ncbi:hypothetical protein V8F20_002845 [Naviculisporaceae sp. PSN 640]
MADPKTSDFDPTKLNLDMSKIRPTPGANPFTETRKEAIASWAARLDEFQKANPDVDFKGAVVEPTVNIYYDMKERLDPETYTKHQDLMKEMMNHLMPPGYSYSFINPSTSTSNSNTNIDSMNKTIPPKPLQKDDDPTASKSTTNQPVTSNQKSIESQNEPSSETRPALEEAKATLWKARDVLKEDEDVLKLFDSVYLRPHRPLEVMLQQLKDCFAHMPQTLAAMAESGKVNDDSSEGVNTEADLDPDRKI